MSGLKTVFKKSITKKVRSWEINTQKRKAKKKKKILKPCDTSSLLKVLVDFGHFKLLKRGVLRN